MGSSSLLSQVKFEELKDEDGQSPGKRPPNRYNASSEQLAKDMKQRLSVVRKAEDFDDEYELLRELGSGITGTVWLVRNRRGQENAMKTINLGRVNRAQLNELKVEVALLKELDHPNVLRLVEVYQDSRTVKLVMDYCKGGSLASKTGRLRLRTEQNVATVLHQMFMAIKYIHSQHIVHRDIKLENVMFVSDDPQSLQIQLIDFGLSGVKKRSPYWFFNSSKNSKSRMFVTACGTAYYMAPEVVEGRYGEECDLWSLGVLTFMLLTGTAPFQGEDDRSTLKLIRQCKVSFTAPIWAQLNPNARILVENLLERDLKLRWTAEKCLESPWFIKIKTLTSASSDVELNVVKALNNFVNYDLMRKTVLMVVAHHASGKELSQLRATFLELDKDGNGTIGLSEMKVLLTKYGVTEDEASILFSGVDVDDSGEIQLTEFLAATMEATCKIDRERLAEAFDKIAMGEEYITISHLEQLLGKIKKSRLKQMIQSLDSNKDGKLSRDEFLALVETEQEEEVLELMSPSSFQEESIAAQME